MEDQKNNLPFDLPKQQYSALRVVAAELRRLPARILSALRTTSPKSLTLDSDLFSLNQNFAHDCSTYMLRQLALHPWLSEFDLEKLGLAFQAGAQWAIRSESAFHTKLYEIVETDSHWFELHDCRSGKVVLKTQDGIYGLGHLLMHHSVSHGRGRE